MQTYTARMQSYGACLCRSWTGSGAIGLSRRPASLHMQVNQHPRQTPAFRPPSMPRTFSHRPIVSAAASDTRDAGYQSTNMAGAGQQQPMHLWFKYNDQARKVPGEPSRGNKLDLRYLRLDPLTIALDDEVNLVDREGWTKHDIQHLRDRLQNGHAKDHAIKVEGDPVPATVGVGGGAAVAAVASSSSSPSSSWRVELEGDVCYYVGEDGARDTAAFYLDPNQEVGRRILLWATQAHNRQGALSTLPHHPLVVSGLPKTGKSATVTLFLPALLRTYGFGDHSSLLSKGGMPPPPEAPGGPAWSLWPVNCLKFTRTQGQDGFLLKLLQRLQRCALKLGFSAVTALPSVGDPFEDIMSLLDCLPADQLHVIVVDEAQSFFLLEKDEGGRSVLDRMALRDMRRTFKMLIAEAPAHVLWVLTGSTTNMLIANLAEAPVNGFAMLNHCDILHLSASVSEEALGLAWSLLKAGDPSLPDDLLLAPLRHHAMLAHLCDEWRLVRQPVSVPEFWKEVLERKVLPEVAADLRVVLELMEEKGTYFGGVDGATHLAQLVQLLDPFQGVPRSSLHRYYLEIMRPYLRPVGTDEVADADKVFVDCPMYHHLLQMVTTADGKPVRFAMGDTVPWAFSYWDMERLRQFGKLVNIAQKAGFTGHSEVKDLLEEMAAALGKGINQQPDINQQPWYKAVLAHPNTQKHKNLQSTPPPAELTGIDAVQWGIIQLRHCTSHQVGSHASLLDACRGQLLPFAPKMDEIRLNYMLKLSEKHPPVVKPVALC